MVTRNLSHQQAFAWHRPPDVPERARALAGSSANRPRGNAVASSGKRHPGGDACRGR